MVEESVETSPTHAMIKIAQVFKKLKPEQLKPANYIHTILFYFFHFQLIVLCRHGLPAVRRVDKEQ